MEISTRTGSATAVQQRQGVRATAASATRAGPPNNNSNEATVTALSFATAALVRVLVGYQPHSGQDNHHGSSSSGAGAAAATAYGGDFEAQRHWMELTWHLPLAEWYWYDLPYWGLDYPPLTAYHSWLCGGLSSLLVGPASVALVESRGYEDPVHKSFMRATVLATDLLIYGTAVWALTAATTTTTTSASSRVEMAHPSKQMWSFCFAMIQPAIVLIDHGHFQYNTVALGFSLWAFFHMTTAPAHAENRWGVRQCVIASVYFCLALSFKQMTLYYAPAVFFYLLGRCFASGGLMAAIRSVAALGATVVSCLALLWWPFVAYGPDGTSYGDRAVHVLRRIIPLQRGLFEGKVSNLWCALSVKPVNLRQRIPEPLQPVAALLLTSLLILPLSYRLLQAGRGSSRRDWTRDRRLLLWGSTNSALAFFLASFQVHEKSLLLALCPCTILWTDDPTFVEWFSIVTTWTLWPLLQIDRLRTAYVCTMVIFVSALGLQREWSKDVSRKGFFEQNALFGYIPRASYAVMIALHGAEIVVAPPVHLPDLFPVLWSIVGCGFCCTAWLVTCWHLLKIEPPTRSTKQKRP